MKAGVEDYTPQRARPDTLQTKVTAHSNHSEPQTDDTIVTSSLQVKEWPALNWIISLNKMNVLCVRCRRQTPSVTHQPLCCEELFAIAASPLLVDVATLHLFVSS
jgi:hypothetical protein